MKLPLHLAIATWHVATTVTCDSELPQLLKLVGTTVSPMIPGELLIVRKVMPPVVGLQLMVFVALPNPSAATKEMASGLVVHVTFGVDSVEEGRITAV